MKKSRFLKLETVSRPVPACVPLAKNGRCQDIAFAEDFRILSVSPVSFLKVNGSKNVFVTSKNAFQRIFTGEDDAHAPISRNAAYRLAVYAVRMTSLVKEYRET
eukprot:GHVU01016994.1.p3 GENE.GHVU01016994.1~~GHVU01016994.1.p3  ORF type:complete len:104 (+),score=6.78 GHVU01016994.1:794-1105(+)